MFFWRRTWSNSTHTSKKGAANSPDMVKLFENPGPIWYLVNFCPSLLQPHPTEVALSPAHILLKSSDICKPLGRFLKELLVVCCVYGCMGFLRHPRCMGTGSAHTLQEDKGGWRAWTRTINTRTLATTASFVSGHAKNTLALSILEWPLYKMPVHFHHPVTCTHGVSRCFLWKQTQVNSILKIWVSRSH